MIDWQTKVHRLVEELTAQGVLTDAAWRSAFEAIPRHLFVPRFYHDNGQVIDGTDSSQQDAYLDTVYADTTLVTQLSPVPGVEGLSW